MYEFDLSDGLDEFPYDLNKLKKFYERRKHIIVFNVFEINKDKKLKPLFVNHNNYTGCNVLLYDSHYVLCTNISSFMNTSDNKAFPCLRCMTSYSNQNALEKHMELCAGNNVSKATFHHEQFLSLNKHHYKNSSVCYMC